MPVKAMLAPVHNPTGSALRGILGNPHFLELDLAFTLAGKRIASGAGHIGHDPRIGDLPSVEKFVQRTAASALLIWHEVYRIYHRAHPLPDAVSGDVRNLIPRLNMVLVNRAIPILATALFYQFIFGHSLTHIGRHFWMVIAGTSLECDAFPKPQSLL
jgi:hypothetical protein